MGQKKSKGTSKKHFKTNKNEDTTYQNLRVAAIVGKLIVINDYIFFKKGNISLNSFTC